MDDMTLFVPITKIDAAQRLVYGVVTAETPDIAGEVCDYASTKPHYQKWSQNFASASGGKSFGNLRGLALNRRTMVSGREWRATVDEDGHYSFAVAL